VSDLTKRSNAAGGCHSIPEMNDRYLSTTRREWLLFEVRQQYLGKLGML
jgi:hypothetical protein